MMRARLFSIAIGAAAGLLIGWLVSRVVARPADGERAVADARAQERRGRDDAVTSWLRSRTDLLEVRNREEFVKARAALRSDQGRSPYRGDAEVLRWLQRLPVEEVIALWASGQLEDGEQARLLFARWVEADPVAAFEHLDQVMNREWRRMAEGPVYAHWVRTDPLGLLSLIERGVPSLERERKAHLLINAWGRENPAQALEVLDRLSALYLRADEHLPRVRDSLLAAWLETDADAPFEWVEAHAHGDERAAAFESLVTTRLERMGGGEAVNYILGHPGEARLQQKLATTWRNWAMTAPVEAVTRMAELPETHAFWTSDASTVAQGAFVTALVTEQADAMVESLGRIPPGERRRRVLLGMIQGASSNDLGLAQELLERLPESRERGQAAAFMVELWAREDLEGAGEWLRAQEVSASRDVATSRYAVALAGEDPARAAQWADSIAKEELRSQTRASLYTRWREQDADAAEAWRATWE